MKNVVVLESRSEMKKEEKCCICHKPIVGYGNNPSPLKGKKCCDECNLKYVIPERIKRLSKEA